MQTFPLESQEFREQLECELTYLGTFGLNDPIREDISESVNQIKFGQKTGNDDPKKTQVNVKVLTGDHIETAKYVALQAGIVTESEINSPGVCMTGDDFMEAIGGYERIWDRELDQYVIKFENEDKFSAVRKKLKVLARCRSEDKFVLISGTKQRGGIISMTGDSISDAESLKKADVSLCMGSGCDVAKDNSDLVILDNNIISIHRSIKWGRAIFDNVKKFIQF